MRRILVSASAAVATVVAIVALVAAPAFGASKTTKDGHVISVSATASGVRSTAPLDSNPLTKEAFLTSAFSARVSDIAKAHKLSAKVVVGYQFGYPVSVAPEGVTVTLHTPDLKLKGGLNAKVSPEVNLGGSATGADVGVKAGEVGAEVGAESTIIPAADFEFTVAPGKIHEVKTGEIAMTEPEIEMYLDGVQFSVTGALGPVSVRPFATITVTTDKGLYVLNAYGATRQV